MTRKLVNGWTPVSIDDMQGVTEVYLIDHIPDLPLCSNHIQTKLTGVTSFDILFEQFPDISYIFDDYAVFDTEYNVSIKLNNAYFLRICRTNYKDAILSASVSKKYPTKNFLFLANKPRLHRQLLSVYIANKFNIEDIDYSCPAVDAVAIDELLLLNDYDLDKSKYLTEHFIKNDFYNHEKINVHTTTGEWYRNSNFLRTNFKNSVLSIVTEPDFPHKGFHFTEKSLDAWISGHMIIWAGAWKAAESAEKLGFDVFGDFIDHSYQYIDDPIDRVIQSMELNKHILCNLKVQEKFYNDNIKRFQQNIDLLKELSC